MVAAGSEESASMKTIEIALDWFLSKLSYFHSKFVPCDFSEWADT